MPIQNADLDRVSGSALDSEHGPESTRRRRRGIETLGVGLPPTAGFLVQRTTAALTENLVFGIDFGCDGEGRRERRTGCQAIRKNAVNTRTVW